LGVVAAGQERALTYGRGILFMLIAVGWFSAMTATVKHLTADYSVFQIVFFRSLIPLPFVFGLLVARGGLGALRSRRPGLQIVRNLFTFASNSLLFLALGHLALSEATAIQFSSPLIITALSALFLREAVGPRRWLAVIFGFLVVLYIVAPRGDFHWASLVLLLATFCYGVMVILTRILSRSDSVAVIFFYLTFIGTLVSGAILPWVWITPTLNDLLLLILVGLLGALAQLCMVSAVSKAPPPVIAPFEYTLMLWAIGFDLLLWDVLPSGRALLGGAAIAAAGLYIAQRESGFATRLRRVFWP
jgi:drug/metabolite transporter (DMT)-like permease